MPAIGLFLMGGIRRVGSFLASRSLLELICIGLALFAAVQTIRVSAEKRHSQKVSQQLRKCSEGRQSDRRAYEQAQRDAAARNKAEVAKREARSQQISEETKSAYQNDLARLRADNLRLRRKAAPGSAGGSGLSENGTAPEGTDGDGVPLSPDEYLQAQEIELRLMHLQNWVKQQLR